jgi:hypothetical protein
MRWIQTKYTMEATDGNIRKWKQSVRKWKQSV